VDVLAQDVHRRGPELVLLFYPLGVQVQERVDHVLVGLGSLQLFVQQNSTGWVRLLGHLDHVRNRLPPHQVLVGTVIKENGFAAPAKGLLYFHFYFARHGFSKIELISCCNNVLETPFLALQADQTSLCSLQMGLGEVQV